MHKYPKEYLERNLSLILLSGSARDTDVRTQPTVASADVLRDGGFRLDINIPKAQTRLSHDVREAFSKHDASEAGWLSVPPDSRKVGGLFKIRDIGPVGQAPTAGSGDP